LVGWLVSWLVSSMTARKMIELDLMNNMPVYKPNSKLPPLCAILIRGCIQSFLTGRLEREQQMVQLSALGAVVSLFCESV
jgi:hypothetical protein